MQFTLKLLLHALSTRKNRIAQFNSRAALQRCSWDKVFWKYAENLQENTYAEVLHIFRTSFPKKTSGWLLLLIESVNARFNQVISKSFLFSLVKKYLNEHIIYYNFSFIIEKSFWNLSILLDNFTYLPLLGSLFFLRTFFIFLKSLSNYFFRRLA